ncbi:ferritin-like domain-containing protein [Lachnospiraceae bacterium 42-17]|jgi:bacterioferritin|nr:rubrerythrin family protein [Dorea sp.]
MEEKRKLLVNTCSFAGVKPIMMDLPYPPIQVKERNRAYADMLSIDYCGSVSELSAITQYINNENRLSCDMCQMAKTLLGIAVAEMMHLQKLGELIILLGGQLDFTAKMRGGRRKIWTPEYLNIPENARKMLQADIEAERAAISQYEAHIRTIKDCYVNAVLARIIKDEEYHIILLKALMKEIK